MMLYCTGSAVVIESTSCESICALICSLITCHTTDAMHQKHARTSIVIDGAFNIQKERPSTMTDQDEVFRAQLATLVAQGLFFCDVIPIIIAEADWRVELQTA
jgi:hypothetical protein